MNPVAHNVVKLDAPLGAEIIGLDVSVDLNEAAFREIEAVFNDSIVVVFRDQNLTPDELVQFSRRFGDLEVNRNSRYALEGHPEVLLVSNVLKDGAPIGLVDAGRTWHTDMSYTLRPPRCTLLFAKEVPVRNGTVLGETRFVSTAAAYDALSDDMKRRLQGLRAVHRFAAKMAARRKTSGAQRALDQEESSVPDVVHPVVRTHPITGRKSIYVSEGECVGIEGMSEDEALALIKTLSDHCVQPRFMYVHKWRVGDLLMWDNCTAQHLAVQDYALPERRLMYRTTVNGSIPF